MAQRREISRTFVIGATEPIGAGSTTVVLDEEGTAFVARLMLQKRSPTCGIAVVSPFEFTDAVVTFLFQGPIDTTEKDAEIVSTRRGIAQYILEPDFLIEGAWTWQIRIETPAGTWFTPQESITVVGHLEAT